MSFSTVETLFKRQMDAKVTDRMEALVHRLVSGGVETMEEYSNVSGQIAALRDVAIWLKDVERQVVGGDERKEA